MGVTSIVDEAEFDAARWLSILESEGVNVWYTAPTAIRMLMKAGPALFAGRRFPALRFVASVGEPLNAQAVWWGIDTLGLPIHDTWWQTETGGIMVANAVADDIKPGSMGRPLPGIVAHVVRQRAGEPREVIETPDTVGELALEAGWPSMFRAYLGQPERYRKCFAGNLYLSGDLVRRDADGYYWFVGRSDDVIKSAGHLIGPFEVESVLMDHPAVAEAAVIGVAHPKWDERPIVVAVKKPGQEVSREQLLEFYQGKVAKWWMPEDVVFVTELPHTATGKLSKLTLREQLKSYRLPNT
jgi:acetyl-CoA synthetase